ncbi:unnamed protein product [Rhizophagus irregularis]|nr:unnamed protein product [Rhizophagus irregularis]
MVHFFSFFRWFVKVTLGGILVKFFIYFFHLLTNGSFLSLFGRFFCISCDDQAFGRVKFPMTGQAFGV